MKEYSFNLEDLADIKSAIAAAEAAKAEVDEIARDFGEF